MSNISSLGAHELGSFGSNSTAEITTTYGAPRLVTATFVQAK